MAAVVRGSTSASRPARTANSSMPSMAESVLSQSKQMHGNILNCATIIVLIIQHRT